MNIYVNEVTWSPLQPFLPGTEHFVKQFAEESAKHEPTTVYMTGFEGVHNGVTYRPRGDFHPASDPLLIVKDASLLDMDHPGRVIYYTNDIGDRDRLIGKRYEKVLALSQFHKDVFLSGIPRVQVLSHGIDRKVKNIAKQKNLCIYTSSPDRGLMTLLKEWKRIKRKFPDAELITTYNGLSEEQMEELYWKADFWVYPCTGIELYCIAGIRAQSHGCYPIIHPTMALQETVIYGDKAFDNIGDMVIHRMEHRELVDEIRPRMITHNYPSIQDEYKEVMKTC